MPSWPFSPPPHIHTSPTSVSTPAAARADAWLPKRAAAVQRINALCHCGRTQSCHLCTLLPQSRRGSMDVTAHACALSQSRLLHAHCTDTVHRRALHMFAHVPPRMYADAIWATVREIRHTARGVQDVVLCIGLRRRVVGSCLVRVVRPIWSHPYGSHRTRLARRPCPAVTTATGLLAADRKCSSAAHHPYNPFCES